MMRILESIRARIAAWLVPARVEFDPRFMATPDAIHAAMRDAILRRADVPRPLLEPARYIPITDPGSGYWAEQAVASTHYFTAFDGIAGAAYNAKCEDGVLRPFTFQAGGAHARIVFCLVMLHNGHAEVGTNFAPANGAPYDAELGRKLARNAAMAGVCKYLAYMQREDRYREQLRGDAPMSGRPHPEGVANVARMSRECLQLEREYDQLASQVKAATARLAAIDAEVVKKRTERHALMAKMDLVHSGNFGFEARLAAFLTMLAAESGRHPIANPEGINMMRYLLIACALILAACSEKKPDPVPQPQAQAAQPVAGASGAMAPAATGPVIVNNVQPAAPAQDHSTQNMLLGGLVGYMLGSSGNSHSAAAAPAQTRVIERHYVRERAVPAPLPVAAAPVPAAVKPAGPLPQAVPAPAPASKPFTYGSPPAPAPKVTYGSGFSKPSVPAPAPRPSVSYTSRPGAYSRR